MKQADLDRNVNLKKTRKRELLVQMNEMVPWAALVERIAPYYPQVHTGSPPFSLIHRCKENLLNCQSNDACPTSPLFRALGIGWRSTSSPKKSWPPSMKS